MTGDRDEVRAEAVNVLSDILEWRLPQARWSEIAEILDGLGTGLDLADAGQLGALRAATATLELAGPVRTSRITEPEAGVPGDIRDRVNLLIHELAKPGETDGADDAGGGSKAGR